MGILQLMMTIGLALQQPAPALPASAQSGAIRVIVRLAETSVPIPDVEVTVAGPQGAGLKSFSALTSPEGSVDFENLPFGNYTIRAQREGYVAALLSSVSSNIAPAVAAGSLPLLSTDIQHYVLHLRPSGSISGRVKDANGEPIPNARVSAGFLKYNFGRRSFVEGPTAITDAQGEYRLKPLGPGSYYVHLAPSRPNNIGIYYPGDTQPDSSASIPIWGGEDIRIDLNVPDTPTFRISGAVINTPARVLPDGQRDASIRSFTFVSADKDNADSGIYPSLLNQIQDSDGRFEIAGIPAGSWELFPVIPLNDAAAGATEGSPPRTYATGRTRVDVVNRDIDNVTIWVGSADVTGRVVSRGKPEDVVSSSRVLVVLHPQDSIPGFLVAGEPLVQTPNSKGEFVFRAVPPGTYSLQVRLTALTWYVSDVRLGTRSIYDQGRITVGIDPLESLEIDLSPGGGTIRGFLDDSTDTSRGDYTEPRIVLIPESLSQRESMWLHKSTTLIGAPGTFTFRDVPPGNYKVFAWKHRPLGDPEHNPEFMARHEAMGVPVSVKAGQTTDVRVRLILTGN